MKRSGFLIFYFLYLYAISWWSANLACGEKCSKVGKTQCVDFRKWWEKFLKQLMIAWYSVIGVSGFFVMWGDVGRGQQWSGQPSWMVYWNGGINCGWDVLFVDGCELFVVWMGWLWCGGVDMCSDLIFIFWQKNGAACESSQFFW